MEKVTCTASGIGVETFLVYEGDELNWSYTPATYVSYFPLAFEVEIQTTDGSLYRQNASINITDSEKCIVEYAYPSARYVLPGSPVTIHVALSGSKQFQSIEYHIKNMDDESEEVFVSTDTELIYTPKKTGAYRIGISLTQTNGSVIAFSSNYSFPSFHVTNLYPQTSTPSPLDLSLGASHTYEIATVGDGAIDYIQYTIRGQQWDGTPIEPEVFEGTQTSFTFEPKVAGIYSAYATLVNADGIRFHITLDGLRVNEGIYLTGLTASTESLTLGEGVILTPITQGDGAIQEICYVITWFDPANFSQSMSTAIDATTLDPFTWYPDKIGNYEVYVRMTNASGEPTVIYPSCDFLVTASPINRPAQQPADSSADLTKLESGSLAGETAAWSAEGKQVEITMDISYVQPNSDDPEQSLLKETAGDKSYELLDISVSKTEGGTTSTLTETRTVLELKIPFRYQGKTNLSISRIHGGVCQTLRRLSAKPATLEDGTYYADVENGYLYIYASRYCLFSIAYQTTAATPGTNTVTNSGSTAQATVVQTNWVAVSDNPPTGDFIIFPILVMISTGTVLLFLLARKRFRRSIPSDAVL